MNALGLVPLTGVAAGLGVVVAMLLYLVITRKPLRDRGVLTEADILSEKRMPLWKALSPWLILTVFAILVNLPGLPFYELTFKKWAMPVEIIPGAPEKIRLLWQAYFWILVSTLLALPFLKPTQAQVSTSLKKWLKRAPRPMLASAVFFAIAYIINHSGKGLDWQLADASHNMVTVLANASASAFGNFYPLVAPYLGIAGRFRQRIGNLGHRHADRPAPFHSAENRCHRPVGRRLERNRGRAGLGHLPRETPERLGQH